MKRNSQSTMTGGQKPKKSKKLKELVVGANLAERYMELLRLRAALSDVESLRTDQ
jgi:hypothetical protein